MDFSADSAAFDALAAKIIADHEATSRRFEVASRRMLKVFSGEDNVRDILRDFCGQGAEGGAEQVEAGDVDKNTGNSGAGSQPADPAKESGSDVTGDSPATVGR